MVELMGKEINAILGAQTIFIWLYENGQFNFYRTLMGRVIIYLSTFLNFQDSILIALTNSNFNYG